MYAATLVVGDNESLADSLADLQASLVSLYFGSGAKFAVHDVVSLLGGQAACARRDGLQGLANVTDLAIDRVVQLENDPIVSDALLARLEDWVKLNLRYLSHPHIEEHAQALIEYLDNPYWRDPLTAGQKTMLNRLFEISTPDTEKLSHDMARINARALTVSTTDQVFDPASALQDTDLNDDLAAGLTSDLASDLTSDVISDALADDILSGNVLINDEAESHDFDTIVANAIELTDRGAIDVPSALVDLVAMIREELQSSNEVLRATLEKASLSALTGEPISLEDYRWQVERLANATESLGLLALHDWLLRVLESACLLESALPQEIPAYCEVLDRWPALVDDYLQYIGGERSSQALADYISSQDFPLPFDPKTVALLLEQLRSPKLDTPGGPVAARAETATAEMVSLQVPDDVSQELLDSLLHELPLQMQEFSAIMQRIAASATAEVGAAYEIADDILLAQRIAHTIKGSANTAGIRGIAEIAHHLEDIFVALQDHHGVNGKLARTLVDSADCLEAMCEALVGLAPAPQQAQSVLQEVLDWANRIDQEGVDIATANVDESVEAPVANGTVESDSVAASSVTANLVTASVDETLINETGIFASLLHEARTNELRSVDALPVAVAEHVTEAPHIDVAATPSLRIATTHIDDLLRLAGESKIIGSQLKEGLRRVGTQLLSVHRQNQLFQQLVNELEQLVDIRGITMPTIRRITDKRNSEFDALEMDQYSELHTVSRRLAEVAMDSREWSQAAQSELSTLDDMLLSQTRQGNETQGAILKMRMVPATTIVGRLQRAVRQTSRLLDKEVDLTVSGADTLIDSDSLTQLVDPLMHLMRNAVDHGIERAIERTAKGKSAQGHLRIEFGREGNQILVRCSDDGKGLDYEAIRRTAADRGLIEAGVPTTEAQLTRLILEHGFSTRSEVTQISGRGVGLDVVNSRVHELKGTLEVQSQLDRGCRFVIRLPATLISTHALLVRHGKHTVAVASRGVRQIVDPSAVNVTTLGNHLSARIGDTLYEAHRIETLLGQPSDRRDQERTSRPALLVEIAADRIVAILVQSVVDTIDLVVKPLGAFVPRTAGLVGATILGDGSVVPVMDIPDLLRVEERTRSNRSELVSSNREVRPQLKSLPSVLVVDDSLSVRRSMEQLLRDAGYEVRLARDGLEAVAILEAKKPDILLVDLEMPRMNGMELTTHVRNRIETRDLPVIMITSRSTEKHRKQAQVAGVNHYMTKPYGEDALLERIGDCLKQSA